jgi:hypothetical protein
MRPIFDPNSPWYSHLARLHEQLQINRGKAVIKAISEEDLDPGALRLLHSIGLDRSAKKSRRQSQCL